MTHMDITKLEALGLSQEMIRAIQDTGYEEFTPIQEKAIPVLLEGRDIIGQASTGTGKTAAFGIPAIEKVVDPDDQADPQVLVLCPTRELAMQVSDELRKFSKYKEGLRVVTVYGGQNIGIEADIELNELDLTNLEMIILPGGLGGVTSVRASEAAMNALKFAWDNGKFVAAICAGPTVLADLHITNGKNTTCFPGCEGGMGSAIVHADVPCVRDGKLITGASAGCAIPFGLALIAALKGQDAADTIRKQIVIR